MSADQFAKVLYLYTRTQRCHIDGGTGDEITRRFFFSKNVVTGILRNIIS